MCVFTRDNGPVIIAHRGGSLERPENTISAVQNAVNANSDWQEVDVTLSGDEHVIVIHDDTLDRTTNSTGNVLNTSLIDIKKLCAGAPRWADFSLEAMSKEGVEPTDFGNKYLFEKVPTLREILSIEHSSVMIELKRIQDNKKELLIHSVLSEIHKYGSAKRYAIGSFDHDMLRMLFKIDQSVPLIGIVDSKESIESAIKLPLSAISVKLSLEDDMISLIPDNIPKWTWTIYNEKMARRAIERGFDGLVTDVPVALRSRI